MIAVINKAESIEASVKAPPSKSYTHRAIIVSSLADGKSIINNPLDSEDTRATVYAVEALCAKVERINKDKLVVHGNKGNVKIKRRIIDCRNSGTTLRLISGVASLGSEEVVLTGDSSLVERPIEPLAKALRKLNAHVETRKGKPPIKIKGRVKGESVEIDGSISSQFISSLLIISPYVGFKIRVLGKLKSKPYIDLTIDVMENFGVKVYNNNYREFITEKKVYRSREYTIEGDYSSASYFFAIACLTGSRIKIENIKKDSIQGDKEILRITREMGGKIREGEDYIVVEGDELEGIEVDLSNTPDLLPTIVALACKAKGRTVIRNVEHARFKESDRIANCAREFSKFGVKIKELRDGLIIEGRKKLKGATVDSHNDHRLAMSLAAVGLAAEGETRIIGAECAKVSFPEYFEVLSKIFPKNVRLEP